MSTILPWRSRLAAMDHTKGTSNKMVQEAMRAEIVEWIARDRQRGLDAARSYKLRATMLDQIVALKEMLRVERLRVHGLRRARDTWKTMAMKYRKQVLEKS